MATAVQQRNRKDVRAWLQRRPTLAELQHDYGAEWRKVERELADVLAENTLPALESYIASLSAPVSGRRGGKHLQRQADQALSAEIRRQMAAAALKQLSVSAATGVKGGTVRFNLVNGYAAQKLLFARDLERKPVSLSRFRLVWPLLWQRNRLMPLVQPKGIYCFYSDALIRELAALIGDRSCLEIAAGDGTLSRFLAAEGVAVTATDDYSWDHNVRYTDAVLRQDARQALRTHEPEVAVCSWPPPGNTFERDVFSTTSVEFYIVVNSGLELGSGNWDAYREQTTFSLSRSSRI